MRKRAQITKGRDSFRMHVCTGLNVTRIEFLGSRGEEVTQPPTGMLGVCTVLFHTGDWTHNNQPLFTRTTFLNIDAVRSKEAAWTDSSF